MRKSILVHAVAFLGFFTPNSTVCADDGAASVIQAYIASVEPLKSFDGTSHKKATLKIGDKYAFDQEHRRIVKSTKDQWAVVAIIRVHESPDDIDLKTLTPSNAPHIQITLDYYHSGAAVQKRFAHGTYIREFKNFSEFESKVVPLLELDAFMAPAITGSMDRPTFFESWLDNMGTMVQVRELGDELHFTGMKSEVPSPHVIILKMDKKRLVPTGSSLAKNPEFSGRYNLSDSSQTQNYEYKFFNEIPLPVSKTGEGFMVEKVDGQEVRKDNTFKIDYSWKKVNEESEFPDVEKIGSDYKNLYEFVFEDRP